MTESRAQCSKCRGQTEEGFIADFNFTSEQSVPSTWVAGRPERSFWTGLKLKGRTQLPISTLRCQRCGYLESYAHEK